MIYVSMKYFIFLLLITVIPDPCCSDQSDTYDKAKSSYETLRSITEDGSKRASCMKVAFSQLNATCSNLDETMVNYLALRFTVCHYQDTQRDFPEQCVNASPTVESTTECTKNLTDNSFIIYTQFYTHTRASCYFLEAKLWQEKTEQTIHKLGDVADASVLKIHQSLDKSDTLIKGQAELHIKASELSDKHDILHDKMDNNHQKIDELTKAISEYYIMVSDMLSILSQSSVRLEQMVNLVLGETHQLSSFLFYFTLTIMTFLLTIPSRTSAARLKMISFIVLHFMLERLVYSATSSLSPDYHSLFVTVSYYTRFFIAVLSLFLLMHAGYNYKDYDMLLHVINHKLDQERKENEKFRENIQNEIKVTSTSLHDKFDLIAKPCISPHVQEEELLVPSARKSIHRVRRRLEDSFDTQECVSDYNTPWRTSIQPDNDSSLFCQPVTLDYDSGVEDCFRKELQLSIHKLNVSTTGSSPSNSRTSTPSGSSRSQSIYSSAKRYNLRSQHK
ncbi:hypothetical protein LOD99_13650 [Oopsacas minuta]|uniref:Protein brambleberry n=1 Tax=Oopsacas minuta TaxID=111878 RepID=A0AAV7KME2_9METZ|nr:hypothetical protein LOD99_13650 [Oopsacas minuta]